MFQTPERESRLPLILANTADSRPGRYASPSARREYAHRHGSRRQELVGLRRVGCRRYKPAEGSR